MAKDPVIIKIENDLKEMSTEELLEELERVQKHNNQERKQILEDEQIEQIIISLLHKRFPNKVA